MKGTADLMAELQRDAAELAMQLQGSPGAYQAFISRLENALAGEFGAPMAAPMAEMSLNS